MDRRNLLLNEMGITRWQLYRPEVLQGAGGVSVSEQVKFIVVVNDNISRSPLFVDIELSTFFRCSTGTRVKQRRLPLSEFRSNSTYHVTTFSAVLVIG